MNSSHKSFKDLGDSAMNVTSHGLTIAIASMLPIVQVDKGSSSSRPSKKAIVVRFYKLLAALRIFLV